jgi:hypothetical protein
MYIPAGVLGFIGGAVAMFVVTVIIAEVYHHRKDK